MDDACELAGDVRPQPARGAADDRAQHPRPDRQYLHDRRALQPSGTARLQRGEGGD
jgi:hypothetical protein